MAGKLNIPAITVLNRSVTLSYSFIENQWGEKYIEELSRSDFANMKSEDFFAKILDLDLLRENTFYIVVGSDSGLILPYLRQLPIGRGSKFAVIEHADAYPLIANEYRGLLAIDETSTTEKAPVVTLHSHETWREALFDGSEKPWLTGGQIRVVESNASSADYSRLYMPILREVKTAAEEQVNDISVTINRKAFTDMQFRNASDSITPMSMSVEFGADKTAIVLGGGPSLDLHIDWVKDNRDKIFILAVSRIAGKLIKHDIEPDILVSVDPFDISYEVSKQGILWTDVPLVYNYHVSAKLLQQWQGPSFYLGKRLPWHSEEKLTGNIMSAGPTVSHAAVFLASQLGFTQILMTGVDLCYSISASSHAHGSPEQMIQTMPSLCDAKVETYSGRTAGTYVRLKQSVDSLNDLGKLVNREKQILSNISEEAARCESIPYCNFEQVNLPDVKPDFSTYFNAKTRAVTLQELDELEKELKHAHYSFTQIRALCAKAKTLVEKMHAPDVGLNAKKYSLRLSKIRKQLEEDFPDFLGAIIYDNNGEFCRTSIPTDFEDMKKSELIEWGCHYYELIDQGAKAMNLQMERLDKRIQLRRDEHDPEIGVRQLAARWREDETSGRLLRWKRLNWKRVAPEDRAWVQRSIGKFRSTLNEPIRSVKDYLRGRNQDIDGVVRSLVFLAQNRSEDELLAIERKLDSHTWPYSALKPFTAALTSELNSDHTTALSQFQASIDLCSEQLESDADALPKMQRLIEECLVRMTQCCIAGEDYDSALISLGMLAEMLPSYVVSYAKMLGLCGRQEFAIELLESYIELYPSNKKAHFVLEGFRPAVKPEPEAEVDPAYLQKISGAMQAIMGSTTT